MIDISLMLSLRQQAASEGARAPQDWQGSGISVGETAGKWTAGNPLARHGGLLQIIFFVNCGWF